MGITKCWPRFLDQAQSLGVLWGVPGIFLPSYQFVCVRAEAMPVWGITTGTSQADKDVFIYSPVGQWMWEVRTGYLSEEACPGPLRGAEEFGKDHHEETTGHPHSFWLLPWASWTLFCEQEQPTVKGHQWCPWQILAAGRRSRTTQGMPKCSTLEP